MTKTKYSPATIHALSHEGKGIATVGNKTVFIEGALVGETVDYHVLQKRKSYMHAQVENILLPSEDRQTPPCQYFGLCGGCSLQHMSLHAQLELKQRTLLEQLQHFGKVIPENILPVLHAEELGYRRKARLGVKFVIKKNKLLVGFREKSSRYLADIDRCEVLHPKVGTQLLGFAALIQTLNAYQTIPQIEVAMGDHETALAFRHMEALDEEDLRKLRDFGKSQHFHIYLQPNPPAKVTRLWPETGVEFLTYSLPDYQLNYFFHPLDFTQVNLDMNRMMVTRAIDLLALKQDDKVLDLFCGIGNFTLAIAKFVASVTGIEGSTEMVTRAEMNARNNNIQNARFYSANLFEPNSTTPWINNSYNKILLDPPRAGAKELVEDIGKFGANTIVYISCNPATFARDAGILVHQQGYKLSHAGIMNMFPHTAHIEAMGVFEKN